MLVQESYIWTPIWSVEEAIWAIRATDVTFIENCCSTIYKEQIEKERIFLLSWSIDLCEHALIVYLETRILTNDRLVVSPGKWSVSAKANWLWLQAGFPLMNHVLRFKLNCDMSSRGLEAWRKQSKFLRNFWEYELEKSWWIINELRILVSLKVLAE